MRCSRTQASRKVWFCSGGAISAVTSSGPRSWRGCTGSCQCGLGSMFSNDSSDESRSTMTGCRSGGRSSSDVSETTTIGASRCWCCLRGCHRLGGVTGPSNSSLRLRRRAALARALLFLANLLVSLHLSLSLTGLMALMARCARIAAVRRWRELWRRCGFPTISLSRRLATKTRCKKI